MNIKYNKFQKKLSYWPLVLPLLISVPGLYIKITNLDLLPVVAMLLLGSAVIGAAFYLSWGTELAEKDLGQGLSLALLAFIAVLPEYAVDVVFAWKAGQDPAQYAPLALANMTGANRILIGFGWAVVVIVAMTAIKRSRTQGKVMAKNVDTDGVQLEPVQSIEVAYLAVASLYALSFAFRHSLTIVDSVVLIGIYVLYLNKVHGASSGEDDEDDEASELIGPAARIAAGPAVIRRITAASLLLIAAVIILALAERFAESLVDAGGQLGVSRFLLVQWVAPLASETPEFIAVILLAWKLRGAAALGALISSKINQWTLLVGILPIVFALSSGSYAGLPIDALQREELFLTAAQSVFAVSLLFSGRLSARGAYTLLGLFLVQFVLAWTLPPNLAAIERVGLGGVYIVLALFVIVRYRSTAWASISTGLRGQL